MSVVAFITFAVFVLTFVPFVKWYLKRVKYVQCINCIPGPKAYPLVGTAYILFNVARKDRIDTMEKLHSTYPDIMRQWLGPIAHIDLKRVDHIEKILSSGKLHLQKAWNYKYIRQWLGNGLLTSDGEKWHARRKIITPTFHFVILESFCEIFAKKSKLLVEKLDKYANSGATVDVYPLITKATLDIIAEAAMGTEINAQDDHENEYVSAVYETAALIVRRMPRPWFILEFVYRLSADGRKFAKCLDILHGFTRDVIRQRKEGRLNRKTITIASVDDDGVGKKTRLAFLDLLLEQTEKGNQLSDDDIREEVDTFMFEGHDTTTAGIAWTLFMLGLHPEIQENVHTELMDIFQGTDRQATIQDFNEMKTLDRVIKETLRLYPSVPIVGRTLSEDIQLDQYTLPAGCTVNLQIVQVHKNPKFYPNPQKFDPDRFLPENIEGRHPYAFIPFSAGPRNCIGQKFAMYEEKSVLSSIIRNYRFKYIGKREDVDKVFELIFKPIDGIPLIFEKRNNRN